MSKEIIIKPKFDFKLLFKANLYLFYNKVSYYIFGVFYILICFSIIASYFFLGEDFKAEYLQEIKNKPILYFIILLPFFLIFIVFYSTKKIFKNNYRIKENFEFIFNLQYFQEKGETFDIKHYWDKLSKIKERKNSFLIYHNKNRASIIPKNGFNQQQLKDFKELLNSIDIKKIFI